MPISGIGNMPAMEAEQQNCQFDAKWQDAHSDHRAGSKKLYQGMISMACKL